jgi:hypothetical protein
MRDILILALSTICSTTAIILISDIVVTNAVRSALAPWKYNEAELKLARRIRRAIIERIEKEGN